MIGFSTFFSLFLLFFINFQLVHHKILFSWSASESLVSFSFLFFSMNSQTTSGRLTFRLALGHRRSLEIRIHKKRKDKESKNQRKGNILWFLNIK